jgi:hypothetical protein
MNMPDGGANQQKHNLKIMGLSPTLRQTISLLIKFLCILKGVIVLIRTRKIEIRLSFPGLFGSWFSIGKDGLTNGYDIATRLTNYAKTLTN